MYFKFYIFKQTNSNLHSYILNDNDKSLNPTKDREKLKVNKHFFY